MIGNEDMKKKKSSKRQRSIYEWFIMEKRDVPGSQTAVSCQARVGRMFKES